MRRAWGSWPAWCSYRRDGIGWFRIFGYGIHWKDTRRHRLLFSERNGYTRALTIRGWRFRLLKRPASPHQLADS